MDDVPTFFFSHARQDTETPGKYLKKFFGDLEIKLAQFAGISLDERRVGTIDVRVDHGGNWDAQLSQALITDKAFVAVLTPLYFNRPNCGKELSVFILRHPTLNINDDGALTGVTNVLPIRWLPERVYASNAGKDARIPSLLRSIEDTPADDVRDPARSEAIERYRKKGMEWCVLVEPYYTELLGLIATRLQDMKALAKGQPTSFTAATDAFKYDWAAHFGRAQVPGAAAAPAAAEPLVPQPLSDVVVTYVTTLPFTPETRPVAFAEALIAQPLPGAAAPVEPFLQSLMADMTRAGDDEGFHVFHAAASSKESAPLISRLRSLSRSNVMTAVIVDAEIWWHCPSWLLTVIASSDWVGPVFVSEQHANLPTSNAIGGAVAVQRRVIVLPPDSAARVTVIRRALVLARGDLVRADTTNTTAEALPVLKGVGPTR